MQYLLSQLFIVTLTAATTWAQWPDPGPCSGNCDMTHDPSIVKRVSDGMYFRFASGNNVSVASAYSIAGPWTMQPEGALAPFYEGTIPDLNGTGAPNVYYINGTYYMHYQSTHIGTQNSTIHVASSPNMSVGSWTYRGLMDIPKNSAYNRIDPNLLVTPGQELFLSFGSYWDDIFQVSLQNATTVTSALPVHLAKNTTNFPQPFPVGQDPTEGSFQFAWTPFNNGTTFYYLFTSSGACCNFDTKPAPVPAGDEYKIMVCRSDGPSGPFYDKNGTSCLDNGGTLVLGSHGDVYAPGGQGVLHDDSQNKNILYYHYLNKTAGPDLDHNVRFGWNVLEFDGEGWPYVASDQDYTYYSRVRTHMRT